MLPNILKSIDKGFRVWYNSRDKNQRILSYPMF